MSLIRSFVLVACCFFFLPAGCRDKTQTTTTPDGKTAVTLQLNWKPEPQFGGFYQAAAGAFDRHKLTVDVRPGGDASTIVPLGAGKIEFAIVSADEIVLARDKGNDVVALFAVYQDCPQGIMTHQKRGFKKIEDVFAAGGTLAAQQGLPYVEFLKRHFDLSKLKIVPTPAGSLAAFRSDDNFYQQCFIASEPIAAQREGVETKTFLIAEAGYNPYTTVLATSQAFYEKNPKVCAEMIAACREGWTAYLADSTAANAAMRLQRPDMDEETFIVSARIQKPLIDKTPGIGVMTEDRWATLAKQMKDLGLIERPLGGEAYFANVK